MYPSTIVLLFHLLFVFSIYYDVWWRPKIKSLSYIEFNFSLERYTHFSSLERYNFSSMQLLTTNSSTIFCPVWKYFDIKHNHFMPSIAASTLVQLVITVYFYKRLFPLFPPSPKLKCKQLSEHNKKKKEE